MLNIVIPMAGRGSRFVEAGYTLPKPLIPVHGRPMIEVVCDNLRPKQPYRFIFLCLQEHVNRYAIDRELHRIEPNAVIVKVDRVTEGAACTVLLAKEYFDNNEPLMIANSDQWVDININDYLAAMDGRDGLIMTMWADDPKWSYVGIDGDDEVKLVVEKQVISNEATVGIYNYARGRYFTEAAEEMIAKDLRVNSEFYVAPAYNEMIAKGLRIGYYNVGREYAGMYGMGIPADLKKFEGMQVSRKIASSISK